MVMDKIKNSDKFNSLKLNIKAASRDKSNANVKENPIKHITGIKVLKNHGQTIRQSPRRCYETKKFDLSRLHFSNHSKNYKQQNLTKSGIHEETVRNNYRNFEPPSVPSQKPPTFVERLERDSSGFLKPAQPAPKENSSHVEEEFKTFNTLLRRLADPTIFREVEVAYHCDKIFNYIKKATFKVMKKAMPNENTFLDSNIARSLTSQSSQGLSASTVDLHTSRQSHLSDFCSSGVSKNNYLLRDWSVIKGSGKTELMVTGMLVDPWSSKVIEHNHRSSCIIEKCGNNCVRTVCCSYQLSGKFVEGEKRLPHVIKQHFIGGNFPDNWELVAAKWHSLNSSNSFTNRINIMSNNVPNKRSLEDSPCKNSDNYLGIKKLKPNNNKRLHETNVRGRGESASARSALNLSVQTRSAVRKNRLPIFLG